MNQKIDERGGKANSFLNGKKIKSKADCIFVGREMIKNLTTIKLLEWLLKLLVFFLLAYAMIEQLPVGKTAEAIRIEIWERLEENAILLLPAGLLMLLNWGIEARKWQLLSRQAEPKNYFDSARSVLSGITFSMFIPNRMGDYVGRFLYLEKPLLLKNFVANMLGNLSQLLVTAVFGLSGFIYLTYFYGEASPVAAGFFIGGAIFLTLLVLVFFLNFPAVFFLFRKQSRWKELAIQARALRKFPKPLLWRMVLLSTIRYSVYSFQYLILLDLFGHQRYSVEGVFSVAAIFFIQSLIPSIALLDFGIRGNVALRILSPETDEAVGVLAAAGSLWLINLMIPAVLGYLSLLSVRFEKVWKV